MKRVVLLLFFCVFGLINFSFAEEIIEKDFYLAPMILPTGEQVEAYIYDEHAYLNERLILEQEQYLGSILFTEGGAFQIRKNINDELYGYHYKTEVELRFLEYFNLELPKPKIQYGEEIAWNEINPQLIRKQTILTIEDFYTGKQFKVMVTFGTYHADVETLTKEDTAIGKEIWGCFSWTRRPVLVHFNGKIYAASMHFMPHSNLDYISNNGMVGHVCLHFKDSKLHLNGLEDYTHQLMVSIAAGT